MPGDIFLPSTPPVQQSSRFGALQLPGSPVRGGQLPTYVSTHPFQAQQGLPRTRIRTSSKALHATFFALVVLALVAWRSPGLGGPAVNLSSARMDDALLSDLPPDPKTYQHLNPPQRQPHPLASLLAPHSSSPAPISPASAPSSQAVLASAELSHKRQDALSRLRAMETYKVGEWNIPHNERNLQLIEACLEEGEKGRGKCATEMPKVVVITEFFYACGLDRCSTTGEVVWLGSVAKSMDDQGYFTILTRESGALPLWNALGELITQFWFRSTSAVDCIGDQDTCVQSPTNPGGIPPWKIFALNFWGSDPGDPFWYSPGIPWSYNPLGGEWNLVPNPLSHNQTYLGYDYEGCSDMPVLPWSERDDSVFVFVKRINHFYTVETYPEGFYPRASNATGLKFITTASHDEESERSNQTLPLGLESIGIVPREEYNALLGRSKVMLGAGKPGISPTPYAAWCAGTPVVMPRFRREGEEGWWHQHPFAARWGKPYIYEVDVEAEEEEIVRVIEEASRTPIGKYIPPDMTRQALDERITAILSRDWEALAREKWTEVYLGTTMLNVTLPEPISWKAQPWANLEPLDSGKSI